MSQYGRVNSAGATVVEADLYKYDALGRVLVQATGVRNPDLTWSTSGLDSTNLRYDAFGAVVAKGVNGLYQESFTYDDAGRVTQSTAGDGTKRFYLYDADGHQTAMVEASDAVPSENLI